MTAGLTFLLISANEGFEDQVLEGVRKVAERNQESVTAIYQLSAEHLVIMVLVGFDEVGLDRFIATNLSHIKGIGVKAAPVMSSYVPPFLTPQFQFWEVGEVIVLLEQLSVPTRTH